MLLAKDPQNKAYRVTHATICTGFGDFEQALPVYREVLRETPKDPELHLSIAHALKTLGRTQEAIESYRDALPGRILRVELEEMLNGIKGHVRRIRNSVTWRLALAWTHEGSLAYSSRAAWPRSCMSFWMVRGHLWGRRAGVPGALAFAT
jgi:tetratricopeptide (TPR) repeat protein